MATAPQTTANQALPTGQAGNLAANVAALLQTFGGTKTTTSSNPGDTAALQAVLGQLQGADYNAMLQTIFQQAGGQIPGLQVALGNAIGARSGGNSSVTAALQRLLQQTTIAGQEQIAKQQLQNQQQQVQAGTAIAQATKGTQQTQQQGTNVKQGATSLAQAAALTQLLGSALKLTGKGTIQEALGMGSTGNGTSGVSVNNVPMQGGVNVGGSISGEQYRYSEAAPGTVTSAAAPVLAGPMSYAAPTGIDMSAVLGVAAPQMSVPDTSAATPDYSAEGGMSFAPDNFLEPTLDINSIIGNTPTAPEMSLAPEEWFTPEFNINDYLN
jgi:hypothetical protein